MQIEEELFRSLEVFHVTLDGNETNYVIEQIVYYTYLHVF